MESRLTRTAASCCGRIARPSPPRAPRPRSGDERRASGRCATALLTLAAIALASPASANVPGLRLEEALERALSRNRQLAAFEHRLSQQQGRLEQAGVLPNPEVGVLVENFAGQGDFDGTSRAETTISLGWAIEPGLRGHRVGVAGARSERTRLEGRILRIEIAAETAQRFLACLESQAHLAAASEAVALADKTVADLEARVRAGRAPAADWMRARAVLATAELAREDVTHEQSVAYHRLAAQWGETAPSFERVEGGLLDLPEVGSFEAIASRIDENPALVRLASEERIARARVGLAEARRWPTLTPTIGARRLHEDNDWALVAGVSLPLPVFDRNQGAVAESRASVARARADAETERLQVRTALFEIYEELRHDIHRAEVLRDEVIPRLRETLDEMQRGYDTGRYGYLELRTIQADLLAAERLRVEASTSAHRGVIVLEQVTGRRIAR